MLKRKTVYVCQECGYDSSKWLGRCPGCGAWNTLVEEVVSSAGTKAGLTLGLSNNERPVPIGDVTVEDLPRFPTGSGELDRVLGGGVIPGAMVLVVGDPGVGKSSLTLKVCAYVAKTHNTVLYVTGEESTRQVRLRANRLGAIEDHLFVLSETNLEVIEQQVLKLKPSLVVIDSIQTVYRPDIQSAPGSISQVRESAVHLLRLAKTHAIATLIIGHVLKDGTLAGPRALEHIVDTVLYFEGDRNAQFRVLRAVKNRFGSTNEIGLFEMRQEGLVDVPDASKLFLSERPLDVPGSIVVPTMEGTRPLLVEIQALVSSSPYMPPRRTSDSVDVKRIQLLLAVLEKRVGVLLGNCDVFVKVAGGIKVDEPAVDLGLTIALVSSYRNCNTAAITAAFGEVGLAGEIRAVTQVESRVREAEKMGFHRIILPRSNLKNIAISTEVELIGVETVAEGLEAALQ
ncbi:dna repair protein rada signature [Lucifera butyrica]|uniref:DNA repair protein RadA n=1 Tax=Lucifera butyrica TaxID=1351585 RepID=A0A498RC51_9FIRM|nr:DNA repair protein RadA [Lucifera butyrica]VBB08497.1 dna repair protein rada signature [Lucifera butyrica]